MSKGISRTLKILTVLVCLASVLSFFYYWETTRVHWKAWVTKDPYKFVQISPSYGKTDPTSLIRVKTSGDAAKLRDDLVRVVWGDAGFPRADVPIKREKNITPATPGLGVPIGAIAAVGNLAAIDRLTIQVTEGYTAAAYHLIPARRNGRLVLYHNGHGGNGVFTDQKRLIAALLEKGYAVMAFNLVGYAENTLTDTFIPGIGWYLLHAWRLFDLVDRPLRYYLSPVVAAINHVQADGRYSRIDMIGFSAGGWVTVLAAAIDPRISGSYTVAGPYPLYLRSGDEALQSSRPQYYRPLLKAANYLEMFVLAAHRATQGGERRHLQIFNQFDGCCFRNRKGKLYEKAVQAAIKNCCGGRFDVVIDRTHTRHAISPFGLKAMLNDMASRK